MFPKVCSKYIVAQNKLIQGQFWLSLTVQLSSVNQPKTQSIHDFARAYRFDLTMLEGVGVFILF